MRKTKVITIEADCRDKGKSFFIREKSAVEAERWAGRALSALSRHGVLLDDEFLNSGMAGLVVAGIESLKRLPFEEAEPLLNDMLSCVRFVPDKNQKDAATGYPLMRPLLLGDDDEDGDIEEVSTLLHIRGEVLELHLGFSIAAVLSNMAAAVEARRQAMQTSPTQSEPSLEADTPA